MARKIPIDTIFFDVDGTLVDSRRDIANAVNYTLGQLGLKKRPQGIIVSYVGTGVRDLVEKSLGENKGAAIVDKALEIFSGYYFRHAAVTSKLYPHVKETLEHFRDKRKIILTNRYERFAEATLGGLGIRDHFEAIIGGDDESCRKPSPCALNRAIPRLKIAKAFSIIVGDMAIDVEAGKNFGIKTCWVTYGLGKRKDVEPLKPDFIIDDMGELRKIVR